MAKPWTKSVLCAGASALFLAFSLAESPAVAADKQTTELNLKTVGLMAGEAELLPRVQTIAGQLHHEDGLRILPIAGDGSLQAVNDLLRLDAVDVALIPSDTVAYAEAQGLLSDAEGKIAYLARISSLPVLVVARKNIANITGLANQRISTGPAQSAGFATGELLLGNLGLPFKRVPKSGADAIAALQAGEADAAVVLGVPAELARLDPQQFHILNLPLPAGMERVYAPAMVDAPQALRLAPPGGSIETVASSLVLAVYNWPRSNTHSTKLKLLSDNFFRLSRAEQQKLVEPGTNIAATVVGWQRHITAVDALEALKKATANSDALPQQQGDGQ